MPGPLLSIFHQLSPLIFTTPLFHDLFIDKETEGQRLGNLTPQGHSAELQFRSVLTAVYSLFLSLLLRLSHLWPTGGLGYWGAPHPLWRANPLLFGVCLHPDLDALLLIPLLVVDGLSEPQFIQLYNEGVGLPSKSVPRSFCILLIQLLISAVLLGWLLNHWSQSFSNLFWGKLHVSLAFSQIPEEGKNGAVCLSCFLKPQKLNNKNPAEAFVIVTGFLTGILFREWE